MDHKSFDQYIKQQLEQLSADPTSSRWESLASRIDEQLGSDYTSIEDNNLDQAIRQELRKDGIPLPKNRWPKLADKIDNYISVDRTSRADATLDQNLKESLINTDIPFQNRWESLEQKLIESQKRRRKLIFIKITELAILLLLFSALYNAGLFDGNPYGNTNASNSTTQNGITAVPLVDVLTDESNSTSLLSNNILDCDQHLSCSVGLKDTGKSFGNDIISNRILQDTRKVLNIAPIDKNRIQIGNSLPKIKASIKPRISKKMASLKLENRNIIDLEVTPFSKKPYVPLISETRKLSVSDVVSIDNSDKYQKAKWWINSFGALDLNLINSPFDFVYESSAYLIEDLGLSGGLSLSYDTKLAELELGFLYSEKNYVPRRIGEITGSFSAGYRRTSLEEIKYTIASIPINLKLHANRRGKWSYYAAIGASANLILNSHFDIQNEILDTPAFGADGAVANQPKLQNKPFEEGIVEGGSWTDNTFFTTQVGLGVQRVLSKNISAYVQPSYSYHMFDQGVGPNKDFLHTLSLQLGVKVAIN